MTNVYEAIGITLVISLVIGGYLFPITHRSVKDELKNHLERPRRILIFFLRYLWRATLTIVMIILFSIIFTLGRP